MKLIKLEQHYFIVGKSHKVLICGIPKINTSRLKLANVDALKIL
jgi:hypothetical protein